MCVCACVHECMCAHACVYAYEYACATNCMRPGVSVYVCVLTLLLDQGQRAVEAPPPLPQGLGVVHVDVDEALQGEGAVWCAKVTNEAEGGDAIAGSRCGSV